MNTDEIWSNGLIGKVIFDEFENSHQLEQKVMNWGIDAHLESLEGEKIYIRIEKFNDEKFNEVR